jgi:hypothetical protein
VDGTDPAAPRGCAPAGRKENVITGVNVSESERQLAALEQTWRALEPMIQQARQVKSLAPEKPELLQDPRNNALVRWLDAYPREIVALETLYDAAEDPLFHLRHDNVLLAKEAADRLLAVVQTALHDVPPPGAPEAAAGGPPANLAAAAPQGAEAEQTDR